MFLLIIFTTSAYAAPKADLWPRWQTNDAQDNSRINHSAWADFLDKYLVSGQAGETSLIRYSNVSSEDKNTLTSYLDRLSMIAISKLNRAEQKAVWINLYNALTVHTVLAHYPVSSIRDISSGWFSSGPWDIKLISVEGIDLSLNDIEHRILRPIWQDNRVHYAVNCASLGCPDLQPEPYTAENSDQLLDKAAREFINSSRAVQVREKRLHLSSIFKWFRTDFGDSETALLNHLTSYADAELAEQLKNFDGSISYDYDWSLNEKNNR